MHRYKQSEWKEDRYVVWWFHQIDDMFLNLFAPRQELHLDDKRPSKKAEPKVFATN